MNYITEKYVGFDIKFRKPSFDEFVGWEMFYSDTYSIDKFFNLPSSPVIIDAGAHIGLFSLKAMSLFTGARIFAYEPIPENFALLRENISQNSLDERIKIFNSGLAGQTEKRKIMLSKTNVVEHSLVRGDQDATLEIDCLSLEKALEDNGLKNVDLLKVDIEGAEYEVLFSTSSDVFSRIRNIVLEYHEFGNNTSYDLIIFLQKHGFKLTRQKDGGRDYTGMLYFTA